MIRREYQRDWSFWKYSTLHSDKIKCHKGIEREGLECRPKTLLWNLLFVYSAKKILPTIFLRIIKTFFFFHYCSLNAICLVLSSVNTYLQYTTCRWLNEGQAPVFIPLQWRDARNPIMDRMWVAWSSVHMAKEKAASFLTPAAVKMVSGNVSYDS